MAALRALAMQKTAWRQGDCRIGKITKTHVQAARVSIPAVFTGHSLRSRFMTSALLLSILAPRTSSAACARRAERCLQLRGPSQSLRRLRFLIGSLRTCSLVCLWNWHPNWHRTGRDQDGADGTDEATNGSKTAENLAKQDPQGQ